MPPAPAPGRGRGEARARDRTPARTSATGRSERRGGDPAAGRRLARPARRRRQRRPRLRAQLPAPARARRGGHAGARARAREARRSSGPATRRRPPTRRRRSPTGSARSSSGSTSTPARPARCSARSPRRTSPTGCGSEAKIRVDRRKLEMDTIKRIGRYTVPVELFADVTAELRLAVAPEGQELPSEEELAALEAAEAGRAPQPRRRRRRRPPRPRRSRPKRSRVEAAEVEAADVEVAEAGAERRARGRDRAGRSARVAFSTGSPRPCGQSCPRPFFHSASTSCGSREKLLAPSVLFVHLAERTPVLICLHTSVPEESERRFAHALSHGPKTASLRAIWQCLPRRSRPPRSRRRTWMPRNQSSAR